jgi:hypothetical protein
MEFGVVGGRGQVQEVAEDGKVVETGPRRDDDDDTAARRLDDVEMSVFKSPSAQPTEASATAPILVSTPSTGPPSYDVAVTTPDNTSGGVVTAVAIATPAGGDEKKNDASTATPAVVATTSGTDAFDDDGPRKPRNRGFDEEDDGPRKKGDRNVD